MPQPQYSPKPSTYAGVAFRSRLEARWAVFLDNHPNVRSWKYEPFTLELSEPKWDYTPDFEVTFRGSRGSGQPATILLEVKPSLPSDDYEAVISAFANVLNGKIPSVPLYVISGDFFYLRFTFLRFPRTIRSPTLSQLFPNPVPVLQLAAAYRFDLRG